MKPSQSFLILSIYLLSFDISFDTVFGDNPPRAKPTLTAEEIAKAAVEKTTVVVTNNNTTEAAKIKKPNEKGNQRQEPSTEPNIEPTPEVVHPKKIDNKKPLKKEPVNQKIEPDNSSIIQQPSESRSHPERTLFLVVIAILGCYLCFHNKNKILGLIVEGRSGRGHGRRTTTARYRRLNTDDASIEAGIQ